MLKKSTVRSLQSLDFSSDGNDISGDIFIEQSEMVYDEAGNLIQTTSRQRFHDDSEEQTGPLGDVTTNPKARVTYQAMWPDAIGRVRATADYGTNGAADFVRPGVAPARSDTVLVSTTRFALDGQPGASIDPMGVETRWCNDAAGRRIKLIENAQGGPCNCAGPDVNRTTEYGYSPDGLLEHLTLRNEVTGNQVTRWVYGTTLADSEVARNDLLRAKIYPQSDDDDDPLDDGIDGVYERIEYGYNAQGQVAAMKDPNGTEHEYDYDELGRLLHDRVTTLAEGIDSAILRVSREYEVRGMLSKITSYDDATVGSGSIINEVEKLYDDFGNLGEDYQSASGAVDTGSTPSVAYANADGTGNTTRRESMTVGPTGVEIDYSYDATETDDQLSRVSSVGIAGEGDKVAYTYVGAARVVEVGYPQPAITLSYIKGDGEPVGDAGDPYTGYDRFGRTVDMPWRNGDSAILDRFQYGYDRAGNRRWKQNLAASSGQDEFYGYDGLYQVKSFARGDVNLNRTAIGAVPQQSEAFDYDPTGNWERYQQMTSGSSVLDQTRVHNRDNQMVQIDGSASGISYDLAGNATLLPPTGDGTWDSSYQLVWDAWNRLVAVKSADGETTIAAYSYDGLFRRLISTVSGATRQCLYNDQWKAVLDWDTSAPTTTRQQYLWGAMHRDELILRDRDNGDSFNERLYVLHDYFSPTAITDTSASVLERYAYSAFGIRRVMDAAFDTLNGSAYDWTFAFQGQFRDDETGFYNYGYRYYSPELGRWLSRDPIGERGGVNLYSMADNDCLNKIDPDGRETTWITQPCDNDVETKFIQVVQHGLQWCNVYGLNSTSLVGLIRKAPFIDNGSEGAGSTLGNYVEDPFYPSYYPPGAPESSPTFVDNPSYDAILWQTFYTCKVCVTRCQPSITIRVSECKVWHASLFDQDLSDFPNQSPSSVWVKTLNAWIAKKNGTPYVQGGTAKWDTSN